MKFKQLLTVCLFGCVALANAEISNVVIELKSGKEIGFLLGIAPVAVDPEIVAVALKVTQGLRSGTAPVA